MIKSCLEAVTNRLGKSCLQTGRAFALVIRCARCSGCALTFFTQFPQGMRLVNGVHEMVLAVYKRSDVCHDTDLSHLYFSLSDRYQHEIESTMTADVTSGIPHMPYAQASRAWSSS
jgi:hypothetical protein